MKEQVIDLSFFFFFKVLRRRTTTTVQQVVRETWMYKSLVSMRMSE